MDLTQYFEQCNRDIENQENQNVVISERCCLSSIFTFSIPDNIKDLSIELKDKTLETFLTASELAKLIISYISSKTQDIKIKGDLAEDAKCIIAFAIKFFKEIEIVEQVDKIKIVIKDSIDIMKILIDYGKFIASCCKTTINKIYKYLKQEVKKGYEFAKSTIDQLKDNFLKYSKHIFAKLIGVVYKTYSTIKSRGTEGFEIEKYIIKCPEYVCKSTIIDTWFAVVAELNCQINFENY